MELWWHSTGFPLMVSLAQQIRWFLQESRQTAQGHSQRRAGRHTRFCAGGWGLLSNICQQQNGNACVKCVCSRNGTEAFTPLTHNPDIWVFSHFRGDKESFHVSCFPVCKLIQWGDLLCVEWQKCPVSGLVKNLWWVIMLRMSREWCYSKNVSSSLIVRVCRLKRLLVS